MRRATSAVLIFALVLPTVGRAQPAVDEARALPIVAHVASESGQPVLSQAALAEWEQTVSALYAGAGLCVRVVERRALPVPATLERIADRRRLARFVVPRRVNVFLVAAILDPVPSASTRRTAARFGFAPTGLLNGAHVPVRDRAPGTYLIVRAGAGPTTLAHELGHLLGAGHHRDPTNLMSYARERVRFDEHQLRTFRSRAARLARTGALERVPGGCPRDAAAGPR